MALSSQPATYARLAIIFLGVLLALILSSTISASNHTVPVTVTITRFIEVDDPDPAPLQGDGDYYSRVNINNMGVQQSGTITGEDFAPDWTFSRTVPLSDSPIPITIEILDSDGGLAGPDDEIDLDPADMQTVLNLTLDLNTGDWSGDVPTNQAFSQGEGDTEHSGLFEGGEAGKVFFTISTLSTSGDADGDGLFDGWEQKGLDMNGNGIVDVDLPGMGADPLHKDLFLEFDWMTGEEPTRSAVQAFKAAFAAAPIDAGGASNPDGAPGINLWVDTGSLADSSASEDGAGPNTCGDGIDNGGGDGADGADTDCLVGDNLGGGNAMPASDIAKLNSDFYNAKNANFNNIRRWVFRYAISARPDDFGGGWGEVGGNDFIEYNHDAGTYMHEFGHNLNLRHGGDESANCKPNYVSAMNYDYQFGIPRTDGGMTVDYSPPRHDTGRRASINADLVENNLDETAVIDSGDADNRIIFVDGTGAKVQSAINAAVDWNGDGDTTDTGVTANIDTSGTGGNPEDCTNGSSNNTLEDYDDWTNISLPFRQFGDSSDGPVNLAHPDTPEMTVEEMLELQEEINTTDLEISKTDSVDPVAAGDDLTYTLTVFNNGPNPADHVHVTDELPTGVSFVSSDIPCDEAPVGTLTCHIESIPANMGAVFDITVAVDADLVYNNGGPMTITNEASVSHEAGPDSDESNNEAEEETQVIAVADLEIVSFDAVDPPSEVIVGEEVVINLEKEITNNGPSSPMDVAVEVTATPPSGATITLASAASSEIALAEGEVRLVEEQFTIQCNEASHHEFVFDNHIEPVNAEDLDPDLSNNDAQVALDIECVVPVTINIKPGSDPNSVNSPRSTIPVAILTTEAGEYGMPLAFDAELIDWETVRFGTRDEVWTETGGAVHRHRTPHFEDSVELDEVTRDGDTDLVLQFISGDSSLTTADTEACVKGEWTDAAGDVHSFFGCDTIRIVRD